MDDDGLIARLAAGDGAALKELFARHAPWLAARLRMVLPASDVEDLLQETFLAVWRAAPRYRPEGKAGAWLWGIARRQAAMWLRHRGSAAALVSALEQTVPRALDDLTEGALARVDLDDAVAELGPPEREVWTLLCVEDRSVAQVAELMGIPVGTVKSRAHRARRLLKTALGGRLVMEGGALVSDSYLEHGRGLVPGRPPEAVAPDVDLDKVWTGVAAELWRRHPGWLERAAGRLLRSPGLARALLTTPSLLAPWLIASVVVLGAGAAATTRAGQPLVALLAPALAGAGIAYAYGPGVDPAWELSTTMAVSNRMVLLVRALVVFGLDALLGLAASAASGTASGITFGWLVPMTAVSAFALAVATVARSANVGVAGGLAGWAIVVLSAQATAGHLHVVVSGSTLVLPYLAFAACCAAVTLYATRTPKGASWT